MRIATRDELETLFTQAPLPMILACLDPAAAIRKQDLAKANGAKAWLDALASPGPFSIDLPLASPQASTIPPSAARAMAVLMEDGSFVVMTLLDTSREPSSRLLDSHRVALPSGRAAMQIQELRSAPLDFSTRVFASGAVQAIVEQGLLGLCPSTAPSKPGMSL